MSSVQKTKQPGRYDADNLEKLSASYLVEISVTIEDTDDHLKASKQLKLFSTQLSPIIEMEKVDYMAK